MSNILTLLNQSEKPPLRPSELLGHEGEKLAARYLQENGYRLVLTNFKAPVGRNSKGVQVTGEIDIIALDGDTLCFVEVKARRSEAFAPAITAVHNRKQRQIARTARVYRRLFSLTDMPKRYDVVTVIMNERSGPQLTLSKGHWNDGVLTRKVWREYAWEDRF